MKTGVFLGCEKPVIKVTQVRNVLWGKRATTVGDRQMGRMPRGRTTEKHSLGFNAVRVRILSWSVSDVVTASAVMDSWTMNKRMNKMKGSRAVKRRYEQFVRIAKYHGVDARLCRTQSSHYALWLSRGEDEARPIFFASTSNNRRIALYERQLFTKGMRSLGIDINNTGLSLSFHACG